MRTYTHTLHYVQTQVDTWQYVQTMVDISAWRILGDLGAILAASSPCSAHLQLEHGIAGLIPCASHNSPNL